MDARTLSEAMGGALPLSRYEALLPAWNDCLRQAHCTTVNRAAMIAAQIGHESSGLRYMNEIASGAAYEGRRDLGNTQPGDGKRFKGHGPIQITGRANHLAVSRWAHGCGLVPSPTYFVDHPEQLGDDRYGFIGPVWYWTVARSCINGMCDVGDVVGVTKAINGGTHGLADRTRRWNACLRLGTRLLPSTVTPPAPARPKGLPKMIERPIYPSPNPVTGRIICPVGSASATVGRAWFSASFDGGARVEAWFQRAADTDASAPGSGKPIDWTIQNAQRPWVAIPDGTEFIQYRVSNVEGAGALAVELAAK